jgi:hypothetical protein
MGHYNNVVANLEFTKGHWLIDADVSDRPKLEVLKAAFATRFRPSYEDRRPIAASHVEAHEPFAHPGKQVIDHLDQHVMGISLTPDGRGPYMRECSTCIQAKMTEQISRRTPEDKATRPFYRIALDLVQLVPTGQTCYNGDKYLLHAVDEYSKWHEAITLTHKSLQHVLPAIKDLLAKIKRQYNYVVIVLKIDGDRGYGQELYSIARHLGIKIELRAPDTPAQLGLAEQAGNVIIIKARALKIHAGLPKTLSNELAITAARIANVTPTEANGWKTPYEMIKGKKPSVAHWAPIGCKAYVLNKKLKKADKLESRTFGGYLVGYDSSNIYRIWLPKQDRVIRVRDVLFQRRELYSDDESAVEAISPAEIEVLDVPPISEHQQEMEIENVLSLQQEQNHTQEKDPRSHRSGQLPTPEPTERGNTRSPSLSREQPSHSDDTANNSTINFNQSELGIDDLELTTGQTEQSPQVRRRGRPPGTSATTPWGRGYVLSDDYEPDRRQNNAPARRDPAISTSNIITGSRRRREGAGDSHFAFMTAFVMAIEASEKLTADAPVTRLHRDQLPPPPRNWKSLKSHQFSSQFTQAAKEEFNSCLDKNCFDITEMTDATADADVVPLMWVFTYKFDEDGYLYKFKARLCVRGDLQAQYGDTYAATLAARTFRALIAISAAFGLIAYQYDAPNAFLNAEMTRKLYVRTPDGFKGEYGHLLLLRRALYGLKEAPMLWMEHLKNTLLKLGLKPVSGVPCLYTNDHLIIFFYVDDIVILVHPSKLAHHKVFEQQLLEVYKLRCMGELKWFLGIRVLRDYRTKQIWLIQDSFIDKVAAKFGLEQTHSRYPDSPLAENYLEPSKDPPDDAQTEKYQQLVGSLGYLSSFTRPDIARTHSILARHLQNPGPAHIRAAIHCWRYVIGTKNLATRAAETIQSHDTYYSKPLTDPNHEEPLFYGASDASFADEPETRRSSQGYLFKLYGMPIDWKATVQRTVTRSTTEAELLALSQAGAEMEGWKRFFHNISFDPEIIPTLWCDNQQTVSLVTKKADKLHTKLRHVDIHQNWVRQEVTNGNLRVQWKPTAIMPADGLTKILPRQRQTEFIRQLGLVDVTKRLRNDARVENSASPTPEALSRWY